MTMFSIKMIISYIHLDDVNIFLIIKSFKIMIDNIIFNHYSLKFIFMNEEPLHPKLLLLDINHYFLDQILFYIHYYIIHYMMDSY